MIRITSTERGSETIVSLAGRLDAKHLLDLREHCSKARSTMILDLSELQTADEEAFRWLRRHVERGVRVTGASPYIKLRLEREPD